jgi:hypothetical protein
LECQLGFSRILLNKKQVLQQLPIFASANATAGPTIITTAPMISANVTTSAQTQTSAPIQTNSTSSDYESFCVDCAIGDPICLKCVFSNNAAADGEAGWIILPHRIFQNGQLVFADGEATVQSQTQSFMSQQSGQVSATTVINDGEFIITTTTTKTPLVKNRTIVSREFGDLQNAAFAQFSVPFTNDILTPYESQLFQKYKCLSCPENIAFLHPSGHCVVIYAYDTYAARVDYADGEYFLECVPGYFTWFDASIQQQYCVPCKERDPYALLCAFERGVFTVQQCYEGFFFDEVQGRCVPCGLRLAAACERRNETVVPTLCVEGYTLFDNGCYPCSDPYALHCEVVNATAAGNIPSSNNNTFLNNEKQAQQQPNPDVTGAEQKQTNVTAGVAGGSSGAGRRFLQINDNNNNQQVVNATTVSSTANSTVIAANSTSTDANVTSPNVTVTTVTTNIPVANNTNNVQNTQVNNTTTTTTSAPNNFNNQPVQVRITYCQKGYFILQNRCVPCNAYIANCDNCFAFPGSNIPICADCQTGYYIWDQDMAPLILNASAQPAATATTTTTTTTTTTAAAQNNTANTTAPILLPLFGIAPNTTQQGSSQQTVVLNGTDQQTTSTQANAPGTPVDQPLQTAQISQNVNEAVHTQQLTQQDLLNQQILANRQQFIGATNINMANGTTTTTTTTSTTTTTANTTDFLAAANYTFNIWDVNSDTALLVNQTLNDGEDNAYTYFLYHRFLERKDPWLMTRRFACMPCSAYDPFARSCFPNPVDSTRLIVTACLDGYFLRDGRCQPCGGNCAICYGNVQQTASACLKCAPGFYVGTDNRCHSCPTFTTFGHVDHAFDVFNGTLTDWARSYFLNATTLNDVNQQFVQQFFRPPVFYYREQRLRRAAALNNPNNITLYYQDGENTYFDGEFGYFDGEDQDYFFRRYTRDGEFNIFDGNNFNVPLNSYTNWAVINATYLTRYRTTAQRDFQQCVVAFGQPVCYGCDQNLVRRFDNIYWRNGTTVANLENTSNNTQNPQPAQAPIILLPPNTASADNTSAQQATTSTTTTTTTTTGG